MKNNIKFSTATINEGEVIRNYCLEQIKIEYGYDYTQEWHRDLDSLLTPNGDYSKESNGAFLIAKVNNEIVGSCGMRNLMFKESNYNLCVKSFGSCTFASLWRTYVPNTYRGNGIASELVKQALAIASNNGYNKMYLHTSWNQPDSVRFWENREFSIFSEDDNEDRTVHMIRDLYSI